jgi:hypothetical protein
MAKAFLAEKVEHGLRRRQQFLVEASHRIPLPHHRKPRDVKHDETAVLRLARDGVCSEMKAAPRPAITACLMVSLESISMAIFGCRSLAWKNCSISIRVPEPRSRVMKVSYVKSTAAKT